MAYSYPTEDHICRPYFSAAVLSATVLLRRKRVRVEETQGKFPTGLSGSVSIDLNGIATASTSGEFDPLECCGTFNTNA